jgi:glucose-6-phosphate isomerase
MKSLEEFSGLPIEFDPETFELRSTKRDWSLPEPALKMLDELRPVLRDPDCKGPDIVYWMYRDISLAKHAGLKDETGLRYDISVFRGDMLGTEFFKTAGHYHPYISDLDWKYNLSWPEVYEVLYGECIYVLQKVDDIYSDRFYGKVDDFIIVHAKPGQKVVMPPNYGHVTINARPGKPLVMSNWVCNWFKSYYDPVAAARGFGWWLVTEGKGKNKKSGWMPNPNYKQPLPDIREAKTLTCEALGLCEGAPMYPIAAAKPEKFEWVCKPQNYLEAMWASLELR